MTLAIIRIRGRRNLSPKIRKTLEMLSLHRTNQCVLMEDTPALRGMLQVCKDYAAFGPVSGPTVISLMKKRGEKGGRMLSEIMEAEEIEQAAGKVMHGERVDNFADRVFRLHPPRKGFRDIKKPASAGGDLGWRDDMDALVKRMM
ncbi:MAG: uL30 family ribosomal protein [Candidatus Micrarchaeota archaeon]